MMLCLPGAPALSDFRLAKLLATIKAKHPTVTQLTARFVHFVALKQALRSQARTVLDALLTYGPRAAAQSDAAGQLILVIPRPGTISPWSSKATDIAHVCELEDVERIERGIAFQVHAAKA